jgi:hypothetical protein
MRNYWFRIALGAFAIFGVGMLIWSGVREGKRQVSAVVHSAEPITVPLAFVPFTVDGRPLGTMRRVRLVRSTPDRVQAINFRVKLADSVADSRFTDCVLVVGGALENVSKEQMFSCVASADTAGRALEKIGEIETQRGTTLALLGEPGTLASIHLDFAGEEGSDSLTEAAIAQAESLVTEQGAMSDSLQRAIDSALAPLEPAVRERVEGAMRRARDAERRAREAGAKVQVEAPVPPPPPARP